MTGAWYAIQTTPNEEAHVNLKLKRKGFVTYFPFSFEWQPSLKSKTLSELGKRAYFTNYLFVRCERSSLPIVGDTTGVSAIVHAPGGEPFPIPDDVMDELIDRLGQGGKVKSEAPRKNSFLGKPGQRFRFAESSPWFGFYAQIVRVLDNRRLIAKFEHTLFGAAGRVVEAPVADVGELVEEQPQANQPAYGSPY